MFNFTQIAHASGGGELEVAASLDFTGPLIALAIIVVAIIIAKLIKK
ncbi:hypothetical protein COB87_000145 [Candidatus Wolfebacteria bacterium]|nr:hypothetical protein [Candidatus Wolfebacteria bacterium]